MKLLLANALLLSLIGASVAAVFIMRDAGTPADCVLESGVIFSDCINPEWRAISSWESNAINNSQTIHTQGHQRDLVRWDILKTPDPGHDHIIDVRYSHARANGRLRFHTARLGEAMDMSDYAGGRILFDLRIVKWGYPEPGIVVNVVCIHPCQTGPLRLPVTDSKDWQQQELAIDHLVSLGLDLSHVDIGLAISPIWNSMRGAHFQVDNIRWLKPDS